MKKLIPALILSTCLFSSVSHAAISLNTQSMAANGIRLLAQDWGQTKNFRTNMPYITESNVILGARPSGDRVDAYFAICTATYIVAALNLPEKYSYILSAGLIAVQAYAVAGNASHGINPEYDRKNNRASLVTLTFQF